MRKDISFVTEDGTELCGFLHVPDGAQIDALADSRRPGIVMAHGFSGVKEQIDHYAAYFAEGGFDVLVYDHRGFGTSSGTPRLEVDPAVQLADWRDAISRFLALRPLAPTGVGVWGSSFAGGLAMVLAATDPRVRCVVAQMPNVSGARNSVGLFDDVRLAELRRRFDADRTARLAGKEPELIQVFTTSDDELCALPPRVSPRYIESGYEWYPTWKNEVTLRSVEHMITFEPAGWVPHIGPKPLLMIVAAEDRCTFPEIQFDAFNTAREPKRLVVHQGGHFDTYTEHFEETSVPAREWFLQHLDAAAAARGAGRPGSHSGSSAST
ncbi:alpha/beta hydrolase [Streptomyces sp. NPDC051677]|uniref:alpha/beta hydrolase n=1 Tax=Streptomyces sp. NPDC051677 TaxID=3365669 RepID=UPI0037CEAFDA